MTLITNIVFTRNRPLQLQAYLESLCGHFPPGLINTCVLYKVELFEQEYGQVFRSYPNCTVIKEQDFFSDFLKLLEEIKTKYILFGVDDVVYFDAVDFEIIDGTFNDFSEGAFGFSLRFGYEQAKNGPDPISETAVSGRTIYCINWTTARTPSTRYPFELCATVYPTALVKRIVRGAMNNNPVIKGLFLPGSVLIGALGKLMSTRRILKSVGYFFSPNTLESWTCRWCQNHSDRLPRSLFFQRQCASAIQVNMVNTSTKNLSDNSAEYTVEALNESYRKGYKLDLDFVARNRPAGTHAGPECFKLTRK
ncbi:MAG: hypothetical protein ACYS76_02525 [Planctomycetota bacterium]|jgi:hypothetical protein